MFLIIDTSSKKSLIVKASDKNFQKKVFGTNFNHSEKLLPEISKLFRNNSLKSIEGTAVISGPGSYTGLRVGIATANALSYALSVPVIEVNKLEWLAYSSLEFLGREKEVQICVIISAIHDNIFAGIYNFKDKRIKQKCHFFSGNISEFLKLIKKPTLFIIEKKDVLKELIGKNILKKKIKNNFLGLIYNDFHSDKLIKVLINISLKRLNENRKNRIIKPLYIQKPNITYSQNKKF